MTIYIDPERKIKVEFQLYENQTYYIDFEEAEDNTILAEIKRSKLEQFISWHRGNRYATLTIINFIGNIYFFNQTFDVKSKKFLHHLSGKEQFEMLIADLRKISKNILFSYRSPSFAIRQVNYNDTAPTLLLVFNYFKNIIIDWDKHRNLESNFRHIASNPNFKYSTSYKMSKINHIKKLDNKTFKSLLQEPNFWIQTNEKQNPMINLPTAQYFSRENKTYLFPEKMLIKKKALNYDTIENRFLKFFFKYIEDIAYRLQYIKHLPHNLYMEREYILSFCRAILKYSFLKNVGDLTFIPAHSVVLQGRAGYKEIFQHYLRSRFGVKYFLDKFEQELLSIDLKRISELYEFWVFYKIANAFLGKDIIIESQDAIMKNDNIFYGISLTNDFFTVRYNHTESRKKRSSYSVTLRPDITIELTKKNKKIKFIFDAKYKVKYNSNEKGLERYIKAEDIYKMHTYLDAIKDCVFAVAIYPGTKFYFYEKDSFDNNIHRNVDSIKTFNGVGAIPLVPENKELENQFNNFIKKVKEVFL